MKDKIILASKSKIRKEILNKNGITCEVIPSNIDEEEIKNSLIAEGATPLIISKNLAELKQVKISKTKPDKIVLGADSVIDLKGELISKPKNREEAFHILEKLNGKTHHLISSVCISKNGSMIWNYSDSSSLKMKNLQKQDIKNYLSKLDDKILLAYGVYQIESIGKILFDKIDGNENTIMGLPIEKIKGYLNQFQFL